MFFLETEKIVSDKNLKIFYISYKNLCRIISENAYTKTPDPQNCLIGFTLNVGEIYKPQSLSPKKSIRKDLADQDNTVTSRGAGQKKTSPGQRKTLSSCCDNYF
jgi:hypothetical protein